MDLLQNFYETTLLALKETKNDRLWFKTKLKLGKLYYDNEEYTKLAKVLKELHKSCQVTFLFLYYYFFYKQEFSSFILFFKTDDGEDDLKKGTQLLEIYALEIQMYTSQKNHKKQKVNSKINDFQMI